MASISCDDFRFTELRDSEKKIRQSGRFISHEFAEFYTKITQDPGFKSDTLTKIHDLQMKSFIETLLDSIPKKVSKATEKHLSEGTYEALLNELLKPLETCHWVTPSWDATMANVQEQIAKKRHKARQGMFNYWDTRKYQEMQKETKGGDWYVFQDGSPYVSKWEEMRAKEKGDPEKLMDPGGFRRFFGKQSEWHVHEFGIRNSSTYEGHADEAGLVDGRDDKKLKHKWIDNKGWSGIGTSIKPHWGRRNAKGYSGMHGNINENTTHSEFGAHVAQHSAQKTEKS